MKLRNKLILSCAALAAVATTAVSSTFAWYTQNTEVTAKGVTGQTLTSDQSVLMISKDNYNWGSKVDLNLESLTLVPVYHRTTAGYVKATDVTTTNYATKKASLFETADGSTFSAADDAEFSATSTYYYAQEAGFYKWNQNENQADQATTENTDYLTFDLYFKSGTTDSLNVFIKQFNLVNTTAASEAGLPSKIKLNNNGLPVASTTYTVNMFRALTIDQSSFTTTEKLTADAAAPTATEVENSYKVWDCQSLAGTTDSLGASTTFNAHQYYNAVKGLYEDTYTAATGITAWAANTTYYTFDSTTRDYVEVNQTTVTAPVDGTTYYTKSTTVNGIDESTTNSETTRNNLADTSASSYDYTTWKLGVTGAGSTVATTASSVLKVTFVIYLDGWDKACFDACQGQNFTLDMEFVSSKVTG